MGNFSQMLLDIVQRGRVVEMGTFGVGGGGIGRIFLAYHFTSPGTLPSDIWLILHLLTKSPLQSPLAEFFKCNTWMSGV